ACAWSRSRASGLSRRWPCGVLSSVDGLRTGYPKVRSETSYFPLNLPPTGILEDSMIRLWVPYDTKVGSSTAQVSGRGVGAAPRAQALTVASGDQPVALLASFASRSRARTAKVVFLP